MDDREFLDLIYQHWSKSTGSENHYWMYERDEHYPFDEYQNIFAIDEHQQRKAVAAFVKDEDADFITAIHGSLPDLVRRCQDALDEADRLDLDRDEQVGRVYELEEEIGDLEGVIEDRDRRIAQLEIKQGDLTQLVARQVQEIAKLRDELGDSREVNNYLHLLGENLRSEISKLKDQLETVRLGSRTRYVEDR